MKKNESKVVTFFGHLFESWYVWILGLLSFSCMFIAIVRSTVITWGGLYLVEFGYVLPKITNSLFFYHIPLLLGVLVAGIFSDKFFRGGRWTVNILFHLGMVFILLTFLIVSPDVVATWYHYLVLGVYFFTFGSQMLIFLTAIELSHKKIRGTVSAMVIILAYIGQVFSHALIGLGIQFFGWTYFFIVLSLCILLIVLLFRSCCKAINHAVRT